MTSQKIGIVHPGEMGISLAASALNSAQQVCWASAGRSPQTRERAARFALTDLGTLAELCAACTLIISIAPPHAADHIARQVQAHGFRGLYLDANAIAPQRAVRLGLTLRSAGIRFVDGGIIGGPAWTPNATCLYLSGPDARVVAECFAAGPLATRVIGAEIGTASALKMCYAAYSKGTTALLAAILAAAEGLGVRGELVRQWADDDPRFAEQAAQRVRRATAKAWRFSGEMTEIAATFAAAGLPDGFHLAAAQIYDRLALFRSAAATPSLDEVLAALHAEAPRDDIFDGRQRSVTEEPDEQPD